MRYLSYSLLIATILFLFGCHTTSRLAVFSTDNCQVLAEKRIVKKTRKQPKVKSYPNAESQPKILKTSFPITPVSSQDVIYPEFNITEPTFYTSKAPIMPTPENEVKKNAFTTIQPSKRSIEPGPLSSLTIIQTPEVVIKKNTVKSETDQSINKAPRKKNVGLKILAVVVFVALTFGVMALGYTIAGSGSQALALLVFVALESLLVGLLIRVLKKLNGHIKKKKPKTVTDDYKYPAAL